MGSALLLTAALAALVQTGESYTFEARGGNLNEKSDVRVECGLDLDITVKDTEGERTSQMSYIKADRFLQDVSAVEEGPVTVSRVVCIASELQRSGTSLAMQTESTPLKGQSFTVRRSSAGIAVEASDGSILMPGTEGVGGWEEFSRLLPGKAVAIGDQWTVEKDMAALFSIANLSELKKASLTVSLKAVEAGKATFAFAGGFEGRTKDGTEAKVTIAEGEMTFDVARGRPTSIRMAGGLETQKEVIVVYQRPNSELKIPEPVGSIRTKSRRLEMKVSFK